MGRTLSASRPTASAARVRRSPRPLRRLARTRQEDELTPEKIWVVLVALCCSAVSIDAQEIAPRSRDEAVEIIRDLRRIVTPDGIEKVEAIRIGGIDQFVSVRSRDLRNPVLLVIHGGPGWVAMPTSWWFAQGWEEYFTVVQWDQRGAGKTYVANDPDAIAPTLTLERMQADVEEVVQWARRSFGKERIFVLGHSWGSILGLRLAERHPEWLHAYVGVGQAIHALQSERRGWRWVMEQARAAGNAEAIRELGAIAPYAVHGAPPLEHVFVQRRWLNHFGGAAYRRPHAGFESAAINLAPEYTDKDVREVWTGQAYSVSRLFPAVLATDLSRLQRLRVPIFLFLGRHDTNVSSGLAAEWFESVEAPAKRLIWFEHSAHEIMVEEPGKTLVSLVQHVLPLARSDPEGGASPETAAGKLKVLDEYASPSSDQ